MLNAPAHGSFETVPGKPPASGGLSAGMAAWKVSFGAGVGREARLRGGEFFDEGKRRTIYG